MDIVYRYTLRIGQSSKGNSFFGPGPYKLLQLVDQYHSLHQAAAAINISYSKAFRIIKEAENELGFKLIDSIVGGIGGGGSTLTPKAIQLMDAYQAMDAELRVYADQLFEQHIIPVVG